MEVTSGVSQGGGVAAMSLTYETSPALRAIALAFERTRAETNFPSAVGLAMWATESAWGSKLTGDFNCWGITRAPLFEGDPQSKMVWTTECVTPAQLLATFRPDERATATQITGSPVGADGRRWWSMKRWFASYPDLETSVKAYIQFLTAPGHRYYPAWQEYLTDRDRFPITAEVSFLKAVCEAGYATGDAETVEVEIEQQQNIQHAVQMARAEVAAAMSNAGATVA